MKLTDILISLMSSDLSKFFTNSLIFLQNPQSVIVWMLISLKLAEIILISQAVIKSYQIAGKFASVLSANLLFYIDLISICIKTPPITY